MERKILIMSKQAQDTVRQWAAIKEMRKMEAEMNAKLQKAMRKAEPKTVKGKKNTKK